MEDSPLESEFKFQLRRVDSPDLPDVDKPMITISGRNQTASQYRQTNAAIVTCWVGIILAGGVYGVLVVSGASVWNVLLSGFGTDAKLAEIFNGILHLAYPAILGMLLAAMTSSVSSLLVVICDWTFGRILTPRVAVSISGGLAGYLATVPILVGISANQFPAGVALLAILAMVMGHVGGILAVQKIDPRLFDRGLASQDHYQFQIRHLLVATAWFAILAAIQGMSGGFAFLSFVIVWLAAQSMLLMADRIWLACWTRSKSNRFSPPETSL